MMTNYIEHNGRIAFHPSYYLREIFDDSGLTQEEFAEQLNMTAKNLNALLEGKQNFSIDIASKLSQMLGTTVAYWLNLQQAYDAKVAEFRMEENLKEEREIFTLMDYAF